MALRGEARFVCCTNTYRHPQASITPGSADLPGAQNHPPADPAQAAAPAQAFEVNRTNSIEMADVSNLSIDGQPSAAAGQEGNDEDLISKKAREAQEQVCVTAIEC